MADFLQQEAAMCNILQPDCLCRLPVFNTRGEVCQVHERRSEDCPNQDQGYNPRPEQNQDGHFKANTNSRLRLRAVLELQ